jgi:hypothetical protein
MPQAKVVTYSDDRVQAEITVTQATVLQGMRRTRLQMEARGAKDEDQDVQILHILVYPDLVAASEKGSITVDNEPLPFPPSFEQFLELPAALDNLWEMAVYDLNPHWMAGAEDAEKKA